MFRKTVLIGSLCLLASIFLGLARTAQPAETLASPSGSIVVDPTHDLSPAKCDTGCSRGGPMVGGRVYFVKPFFSDNTAFVTVLDADTTAPTTETTEFDWEYDLAFAGWVGWTGPSGLGARARYFVFDQESDEILLTNAGGNEIRLPPGIPDPQSNGESLFQSPGDVSQEVGGMDELTFLSEVRINALDLEATCAFNMWGCSFLASTGGRFMKIEQRYQATVFNEFTVVDDILGPLTATENRSADFDHEFSGGGPTVALQVEYPLPGSGMVLYALSRGALLVGEDEQLFRSQVIIDDPAGLTAGGSVNESDTFRSRQADLLPVMELEVGLEFGRSVGKQMFFGQIAAVHYTYFGAGSPSNPDANMGIFGVQVSAGINR